jgi:hypothetical protein
MKAMTPLQLAAVERLLAKGWIEPLIYRNSVYLFLPGAVGRRKEGLVRDWSRKPIRVTAAGNIHAAQVGDMESSPATD